MKQETNPPSTLQGQYAGFVSRLLAYTVDLIIVILMITIFGITADLFLRFFDLVDVVDTLMTSDNILGDALRFLTVLGSMAIISFAYFVLGWTFTAGQSVGKLLLGVRIVPLDGSKMGLVRSIIRYFAFLASAAVLFIGLLWVLVSNSRQGWHDKIARTCVIYDWPAREDDGVVGRLKTRWHYVKQSRPRLRGKKSEESTDAADTETETSIEETETA